MSHPEHGDGDDDQPGQNRDTTANEYNPRNPLGTVTKLECLVVTARELWKARRVLERIADCLELKAVLQAQISVPDETAAKLDVWRDNILDRLARRENRRLVREGMRLRRRIEKLERDQAGTAFQESELRGETAGGTCYGEPVKKVTGHDED